MMVDHSGVRVWRVTKVTFSTAGDFWPLVGQGGGGRGGGQQRQALELR